VGVVLALLSGIVTNMGTLFQKQAVNHYLETLKHKHSINCEIVESTSKFRMRDLIRDKLWLFGFTTQLVVGTGLFLYSQTLVGPSLTPALGSIGLVVLAVPQFSRGLLHERLTWAEMLGMVLIIAAVILLSFSGLQIVESETDFLEFYFMIRVIIFSGSILVMCTFCKLWSLRKDKLEGTMLATLSGLLVALSNFWISPFTAMLSHFMSGNWHHTATFMQHAVWAAVLYWLLSVAIVLWSNIQSVYEKQLAFKVGRATTMIPISHVPSHLSPPIIYSCVFYLKQTYSYSLALMCVGILMLVTASFIFGKRESKVIQEASESQKLLRASAEGITCSNGYGAVNNDVFPESRRRD